MLGCGTTTCEAKSGYALTTEGELKMLRAIRALAATHQMELAPTFMGAHEVPAEYRGRRRAYIDLVIHEYRPSRATRSQSGATSLRGGRVHARRSGESSRPASTRE